MQQEQQTNIKARIAELKKSYEKLKMNCNSWARISPETTKKYAEEITSLENQLN